MLITIMVTTLYQTKFLTRDPVMLITIMVTTLDQTKLLTRNPVMLITIMVTLDQTKFLTRNPVMLIMMVTISPVNKKTKVTCLIIPMSSLILTVSSLRAHHQGFL